MAKSLHINFDPVWVLDIIRTELRIRGLQHAYSVKRSGLEIVLIKTSDAEKSATVNVDDKLTIAKLRKVISSLN